MNMNMTGPESSLCPPMKRFLNPFDASPVFLFRVLPPVTALSSAQCLRPRYSLDGVPVLLSLLANPFHYSRHLSNPTLSRKPSSIFWQVSYFSYNIL